MTHFAAPEQLIREPFIGMTETPHGRQQPNYGPPEVVMGGFWPKTGEEPGSYGSYTVLSNDAIILDEYRDDLSPHDRWTVRGKVYDPVGDPAAWRSPLTGWAPGTVVQLRRSEG